MSASDVASLPTDQSLLDSLCATLEEKLATKICASLQKAITQTVCKTLKEAVHDVLNPVDEPDEDKSHAVAAHDAACIREFCPSLEDTVANAVCAALKQSVSDTVCSALKKAIHNNVQDLREAERGAPLHVSPVEFCFNMEDVIANAVCAALKQVVKDTVCEPLKKAITHCVHDALSLAQDGFLHDGLADVRLVYLGPDYVWRPPMHKDMSNAIDACDRVIRTLSSQVCTRLQQAVADTLCPRLRKQVKRTIERHAEELRTEHAVQSTRARPRLRTVVSTHRIAFCAVIGIVIVSLMAAMIIPGAVLFSPVIIPSVPPLPALPASSNAPSAGPSESSSPSGAITVPTAAFSAQITRLNVTFTDQSTGPGPLTYKWDFGDGGTSSLQNPTRTYATQGNYKVTLTVIGSGGTSTATNFITLAIPQTAAFSAFPMVGTAPLNVTFTDQSTGPGPLTYKWDFGDGGTSSLQNPTHPYKAGTYIVTLTVTGAGGTSTATNLIIVLESRR
jgi:chitodextrinase